MEMESCRPLDMDELTLDIFNLIVEDKEAVMCIFQIIQKRRTSHHSYFKISV